MITTRSRTPRSHAVPILSIALLIAGSVLTAAGTGCSSSTGASSLAGGPLEAYVGATSATIHRLDPESLDMGNTAPDGDFHGYPILSTTDLADPAPLLVEIARGIDANAGVAASCFNPRHGLSLRWDDRTVDFVICYECLWMQIHDSAASEVRNELTVEETKRDVDRIFVAAGLPTIPNGRLDE